VGPALGQTADPTLAKVPPDDVTDPPPLFTFEQYPPSVNDNVVLQWDEELLQAVRALPPGPTVVAPGHQRGPHRDFRCLGGL
jgi:hypothetical protein